MFDHPVESRILVTLIVGKQDQARGHLGQQSRDLLYSQIYRKLAMQLKSQTLGATKIRNATFGRISPGGISWAEVPGVHRRQLCWK